MSAEKSWDERISWKSSIVSIGTIAVGTMLQNHGLHSQDGLLETMGKMVKSVGYTSGAVQLAVLAVRYIGIGGSRTLDAPPPQIPLQGPPASYLLSRDPHENTSEDHRMFRAEAAAHFASSGVLADEAKVYLTAQYHPENPEL